MAGQRIGCFGDADRFGWLAGVGGLVGEHAHDVGRAGRVLAGLGDAQAEQEVTLGGAEHAGVEMHPPGELGEVSGSVVQADADVAGCNQRP
ncbi:MAG: hypothetical protein ACRDZ4_05620 [Egibacteraceae bacterium]